MYKVPQDVEAEDKLIGFLSFKQFVFVIIMVGSLFFAFQLFRIYAPLGLIPLPMAFFFGTLGLWPRRDQPAEVYLAAIIQFWLRPRRRIWSQEGHVEHVHITAPKKEHHEYTDKLSRTEVSSRLKMLANTMDTRGWATKNIELQDVGAYQQPLQQSDRLVMPTVVEQQPTDIHQSDDMLDENYNPVAHNFAELTQQYEQRQRQEALNAMQSAQSGNQSQSTNTATAQKPSYQPYPKMHQHVISPSGSPPKQAKKTDTQPPAKKQQNSERKKNTTDMTDKRSTAILNLSRSNDLNISTLSRKAEQSMHDDETIELH